MVNTIRRWPFIVVTALAALFLFACGEKGDPPAAKELYRRAMDAQGAGNLDEAEALFRRVAEEFPKSSLRAEAEGQVLFLEGLREMELRGRARRSVDNLKAVARACERYRAGKGQYPETLDALVPTWIEAVPDGVWGHPYHYRTETDAKGRRTKYFLACFGSDGIPGGSEDAFDLIVKDGEFIQIHAWLR